MRKATFLTFFAILSITFMASTFADQNDPSVLKLRVTVLNHTKHNIQNVAKDTTLAPHKKYVGYSQSDFNGVLYPSGGAHWHMFNFNYVMEHIKIVSVITYTFNNGSNQYPVRPTICKIKTKMVRGWNQARVLPGTGCLNNGVHTYQIKTSIVGKHVTATIVQTR